MLHVLRNERAYWLRKTDPNNVWVRGGSHGENLSFSRVTPALAALYIR
jgi:hypothetical protein